MRIYAALSVAVGHDLSFCSITAPFFARIPPIQNIGVVLLMLLSGFLTAKTLIGSKRSFGTFLCDRFGRIYAAYIPALLLTAIVDGVELRLSPGSYPFAANYTLGTFLGNVFMLQGIPGANMGTFGSAAQLWTLSIEWWLYVAAGYILCVFVPRLRTKSVRLSSLLAAICVAYPVANYVYGGIILVVPLIWGAGVCIYCLQDRMTGVSRGKTLACLALSLVWMIYEQTKWKDAYAFPCVVSMSVCVLFSVMVTQSVGRAMPGKLTRVLGTAAGMTYSLYLIHYSLMDYLLRMHPAIAPTARFWLGLALSAAVTVVFVYAFEKRGSALSKGVRTVGTKALRLLRKKAEESV